MGEFNQGELGIFFRHFGSILCMLDSQTGHDNDWGKREMVTSKKRERTIVFLNVYDLKII